MLLFKNIFRALSSKASKKSSFLDTLREGDRKTLEKEFRKTIEAEAQVKKGKFKQPTLPRHPLSLYQKERSADPDIIERKAEKNFGRVLRDITREFKALSDDEREVYTIKSEEDRRRFKDEFEKWHGSIINDPAAPEHIKQEAIKRKEKYTRLNYI